MTLGRRRRLVTTAALGAALFAGCAALPNAGLFDPVKHGDTGLYEEYAGAALDGEVPYRDFFVVYPPGALPVFVAPALAGGAWSCGTHCWSGCSRSSSSCFGAVAKTLALPLVDRARSRELRTTVHLPSQADGPRPLIVFGHGLDGHPRKFTRLLGA